MALTGVPHVGETVEVVLRVAQANGRVIREGTATAEFYRPGHEPDGSPDHTEQAAWSAPDRGFACLCDHLGEAGTWTVRGRVRGNTELGPATGISDGFPLLLRP